MIFGGTQFASYARSLLKEHHYFLFLLAAIVASRLPFLANLHAVILLNQDFNPIHFGHLFFENDIPAGDDSGVGENSRTFSLASLYFWFPLLFYRLGVPFEFFAGLHVLLVLPLVSLGVYRLALAIFGDKRIACLAVLIFLFRDFSIFRLNLGYPLLLNQQIYYSDANVIFILFALLAMIRLRPVQASCWIAALTLCNPTSITTLTACFGLFLFFSGKLHRPDRRILIAFLVIGVSALVAFLSVMAATPIKNPAPEAARLLAIQSNAHFAPHIAFPFRFLLVQFFLLAALVYAIVIERANSGNAGITTQGKASRHLSHAMLAAYIGVGWIGYWTLYVVSPVLFVMVAPAKVMMIVSIYISVYAAHALYAVWTRYGLLTVVMLGFAVLYFQPEHVKIWNAPMVVILPVLVFVLLGLSVIKRSRPNAGRSIEFGYAFLLAVLLYDFGQYATQIFRSGELVVARAFYDIQLQVKDRIFPQAIFVPYRYPGTIQNQYGPFRNWPFRTYSRKGGNEFWAVGRNIYFNSARRHELETASFAAFGIDLWESILQQAEEARRRDKLFYYTGVRNDAGSLRLEAAPIGTVVSKPYDELRRKISTMTIDEFSGRGAVLGASHVIVSRDPGMATNLSGLLENDYFVVLQIK